MADLLAEAAMSYDAVVIDSPPLLPVTDAAVLSTLTGGTLLLAGSDRVTRAQLRNSLETLRLLDSRILGVVLNKVATPEGSGYYGYASVTAAPPGRHATRTSPSTVVSRSS
jgi:Mrp family chromosome partitioning ATPase